MTREIPLTQGKVALVDDEDYERVMQFNWHAFLDPKTVDTYYAIRNVPRGNGKRRTEGMHRFVMEARPGERIDHRNGNGLDNTRRNLRRATASQNGMNGKRRRRNTSGCPGVYYSTQHGKWVAQIGFENNKIYLGIFDSFDEAVRVRQNAEIKYFGDFRPSASRREEITHVTNL